MSALGKALVCTPPLSALAGLLVALGAGSGCGEEPLRCGPHTKQVGGECVPALSPITCGEGTTANETTGTCETSVHCGDDSHYDAASGACVPNAVCGAGTAFNPATGTCESSVLCGPDTHYNVVTQECEPTRVCAEGTELVGGECVPLDTCGTGTTFDPSTGTCRPDLVCGDGLIAHEDLCLTEAEIAALERDAVEAIVDANDPDLGGVPEPVTLEPLGGRLVFTGTIGRPADMDGDGVSDQDKDSWSFDGEAGQFLRIRILSDGLPEPAFLLRGPGGYERSSQVGGLVSANRSVLLPADGHYVLTVEPAIHRAVGTQIGGVSFGYVGVIEEQPWPAASPLTPSTPPVATTVDGTLLDTQHNFHELSVSGPSAVVITARVFGADTAGVLMVFRRDGGFMGEAPLELDHEHGEYRALYPLPASHEPAVVLFMDWGATNGADTDYVIGASATAAGVHGSLAPDSALPVPRVEVAAQSCHALSFEVTAGQLVTTHFDGLRAGPLAVFGPLGVIAVRPELDYGAYTFYARASGTVTWLYLNESLLAADLSVSALSTTPLLVEPPGATSRTDSFTGADLMAQRRVFSSFWAVIENAAPTAYELRADYELGTPDLDAFAVGPGGPGARRQGRRRRPGHPLRRRSGAGADGGPPDRRRGQEPRCAHLGGDAHQHARARGGGERAERHLALHGRRSRRPACDSARAAHRRRAGHLPLAFVTPRDGRGVADRGAEPRQSRRADDDDLRRRVVPLASGRRPRGPLGERLGRLCRRGACRPRGPSSSSSPPQRPVWTTCCGSSASPRRVKPSPTSHPRRHEPRRAERLPSGGLWQHPGRHEPSGLLPVHAARRPAGRHRARRARRYPRQQHTVAEHGRFDCRAHERPRRPFRQRGGREGRVALAAERQRAVRALGRWRRRRARGPIPSRAGPPREGRARTERHRVHLDPHGRHLAGSAGDDLGGDGYLGSDVFRAALAAGQPLGPREAVSVRWEGLLGEVEMDVSMLDPAGTPLFGLRGRSGELVVGAPQAGAAYFIRVLPVGTPATLRPEPYRLHVERVDAVADIEPNDDQMSAQELPALPVRLRGMSRAFGVNPEDPDVFRFTLPRDLAGGEELEIRASTVHTIDDLEVTLRDPAFNGVASARDVEPLIAIVPPDPHTGAVYFLELRSTVARTGELSVYEATIEIATRP